MTEIPSSMGIEGRNVRRSARAAIIATATTVPPPSGDALIHAALTGCLFTVGVIAFGASVARGRGFTVVNRHSEGSRSRVLREMENRITLGFAERLQSQGRE